LVKTKQLPERLGRDARDAPRFLPKERLKTKAEGSRHLWLRKAGYRREGVSRNPFLFLKFESQRLGRLI